MLDKLHTFLFDVLRMFVALGSMLAPAAATQAVEFGLRLVDAHVDRKLDVMAGGASFFVTFALPAISCVLRAFFRPIWRQQF